MKKKLLASALLACSLVTLGAVSTARAEPLPPGRTTVLETVDAVAALVSNSGLGVEGIVEGESQARTFEISFGSAAIQERCLKFLLLSQSHPGRYQIAFETFSDSFTLKSCKLKSR